MASEFPVMHMEVLPTAAALTAPVVALENLLVLSPVPPPSRRIRQGFGRMLFMTPSPVFCWEFF